MWHHLNVVVVVTSNGVASKSNIKNRPNMLKSIKPLGQYQNIYILLESLWFQIGERK